MAARCAWSRVREVATVASTLSIRSITCAGARDARASARVCVHVSLRLVRRSSASSVTVAFRASTLMYPTSSARSVSHWVFNPSSVAGAALASSACAVSWL